MITNFRCPICHRRNTALMIKAQPILYLYPEEHISFHICDKIRLDVCDEFIIVVSNYGTYSSEAINKLREVVDTIKGLIASKATALGNLINEGEKIMRRAENLCRDKKDCNTFA
ncbi:hypothetical protein HFC64_09445 [Saccharolobus solfataricus]|nr:hypothetical protein [Saccharolobus solfataricus]AKA73009.2 hypothetical protein SULB_0617 [Saccharolobus solfataricus]AKA75707.2 hypothetical protein SULC_0615 [Saccharolobus solfataricus]AKA78399.2 hypothetical protein SULA_0615 [Saccharolobus solfataricus]AZF80596.1 hypothetical protein SULO_03160 [Saccharolobus solfataricus]AZF83204.1 hypothetical protein SULZ_03195 [Saccharolobus solfataricus]